MLAVLLVTAWLDEFFRPYAGRGAIAVAVVHNGQVTVRAYGATPDSVFRMASLSKVVTAYAAAQLERDGRLDLHARIPGTPVTPHHLLTHTSGIEEAFFGNVVPLERRRITLAEHFEKRPPRFGRPPGREIVYSNEGIALLGRVIEQRSGLPFEHYVQWHVLNPLGMRASTFVQPPPFRVIPSGAEGQAGVQAPSGAMVSTAGDMAKFLEALLAERHTYGLFTNDIGGHPALFHTGRSGHESVLYLVPQHDLGLFVVHTGGMGDLRKRFVTEAVRRLLPAQPGRLRTGRPGGLRSGIYRPIVFPRYRIERAALLGADTVVQVEGERVMMRMPPFAMGETLAFPSDDYSITGSADRVTIAGPLMEPITFERIPWYASGRVQLGVIGVAALTLAVIAIRRRGNALVVVLLFLAAPLAIAAVYFLPAVEKRPFLVEPSLRLGLTFVMLACAAALRLPFIAWRSRRIEDAIAAICAAAIVVFLWHWNLLGWRF